MQDILVALLFVGMVACPAIISALPMKDRKEDEADGLQVLSLALAKAKRGVSVG
jgi:hypothetical protein